MGYKYTDITELKGAISAHMNGFFIFDIPEGRHQLIIEEFYAVQHQPEGDDIGEKLKYVNGNLLEFNKFLEKQGKYKSDRLDAERQAKLEPERTKTAIRTLTEMGFKVKVISNNEINFTFKNSVVKYFPYSGWASGKTISDGRGFQNLVDQLKAEDELNSFPFVQTIEGIAHHYRITQNAEKYEVERDGKLIAEIACNEQWQQLSGDTLDAELLEQIGDRIESHYS